MVDPTGLRYQKNTRMLNPAPKNVGGWPQNHLKSYLRVLKTVTREEAYKGSQKLQTYNLSHLTHWNHERTRGVRIDRVYLNSDIFGATLEVQTFHHPGSDHTGVLYRIRGNLALQR